MVLFVHWLTFSHIWTATRLSNKVLKQSLYLAFPNESWQNPQPSWTYQLRFYFWSVHMSLEKLHVEELHFFSVRIFCSTKHQEFSFCWISYASLNATCSMSANIHVCHFALKDMSTLLRSRSSFCDRILTLKLLIVPNDT